MRCKFDIVKIPKLLENVNCVVIRDTGHQAHMSVTNDVEAAVLYLLESDQLAADQRLYYYDSDGQLDELLHDGSRFTGFSIGPA
jgi:hypothetical protein